MSYISADQFAKVRKYIRTFDKLSKEESKLARELVNWIDRESWVIDKTRISAYPIRWNRDKTKVKRWLAKLVRVGLLGTTEWVTGKGCDYFFTCKPEYVEWVGNKESYSEYLISEHWEKTRKRSLRFAKDRCQLCNYGESLNVHHRSYDCLHKEKLSDLVVLCRKCHEKFHDIK